MSDFWVGNFRVDVSRGQVIVKDDIVSLEPRVLKVLLLLAKNQGEVVTHEALLEGAWPNVVVAPNAVQRCIGQLRKALADDAKQQRMIATHPKVGYSLVAKVQWPEANLAEQASSLSQNKHRNIQWPLAILLSCMCLLALLLYFLPSAATSPPLNRLTPITSTDEKEYYPNFSPDGRYLVFNRFVGVCQNQLWAKDLIENREFPLTKSAGVYGPAAWSPDGNQLAFSQLGGCGQPQIKSCRNISAVSFLLAKTEPQIPRELLACDQHNFGGINWLSNSEIAFIDSYARQGEVKSLVIDSGLVTVLYADKAYKPQALTYSGRNKQLAITVHDEGQNTALVLLNTDTNAAEHVPLKVPGEYSDYLWWDPSWHPLKDTLLASAENSLFEIDMAGVFTEYPVTTVSDIYNPLYHPGGDKIVAVMGGVDLDIAEYSFAANNLAEDDRAQISMQGLQTIHHSTMEDYQAKYQPATTNISFVSTRSGEQQIWFSQHNQLRQLSHFDANTRITSYAWSLDGQALALAVRGKLQLLTLDGQAQSIATPFKVVDVYQWVNKQQVLLSIIEQAPAQLQQKQRKVVLFDINTGAHQVIYQGFSHWAQLDDDQSLYYTDWDKTLHVYQDNKSTISPATTDMEFSSGFMIKQDQLVLFGQSKIWLYDLEKRALSSIELPSPATTVANLTDIDYANKRLLFSIYQDFRKDLVMFQR
ncbi:winged helix-turn-helix domain-containing protein [Thalassotalea sp. ND16A]|uniref:winged helix-turn-helix domain-containing protein n=1 Tax=Thalassotalea sp. ND16A TaxID=1535422 RepID=UPI000519EE4C|nr:winged helix-turn-helix domain-containing protein [Thalassotalea sp. ND16A]KGK00503.1 putative transcriptional regulator, CadC [Thalassotalea sp. ND16A]